MALKLDVLANTRQFVSEMKKAGASTEDVTDSLDDMAREGAQSGDRLERTFRDLAREAERTDKKIEKVGGKGGGLSKASQASAEFKQEALQNFAEVTASFDGSMESIGELAQGTLGGVSSAVGPALGLAAGAIAIAVGTITSNITAIQERSQAAKDAVIGDFVELGDALDEEAVNARVRDILGTKETLKQAQDLKKVLGGTLGEAALVLAGDFETAGVSAEDALKKIASNTELSTYDLISLEESVKAVNGALEAGPEIAAARREAERRTSEESKRQQKQVQSELDRTRQKLQGLAGEVIRPTISPILPDVAAARRRLQRDLNGTVISVNVQGISGRRLT